MWIKLFIIGAGGFVGSVLRFGLGGFIQRASGSASFPIGTMSVNILGCFLIGLLGGWAEHREVFSPEARMFLLIGLLGGFTTFSTFGFETFNLLRDNQVWSAMANAAVQVVVGVLAVWIGFILSNVR